MKTSNEDVIVGGETSDQALHGFTGFSASTFFPILLMYTKLTDLSWGKVLNLPDQTIAGLTLKQLDESKVVVLTSSTSVPSSLVDNYVLIISTTDGA